MKGKRILVFGIFLGTVFGWTLGFLRLPYIEKNYSFLMGFISCLALVAIGGILLYAWNKNAILWRMIGKGQAEENPKKNYALLWLLISAFILLGGSLSSWLIFKQNEFFKIQTQRQNEKIAEQSTMMETTRKSNLIVLMNNLYDDIKDELKNQPERTLSDETIARIVALNFSFKPYRSIEGDSLSEKKLSPERGQLLLLLATLKMDTSSFNEIKRQTSFFRADLEGANLKGADLSGVDLREANLEDAILSEANLSQADLRHAYLVRSNLKKANLNKGNLESANMKWADLSGANLKEANLNVVDLTSARLTRADLRKATMTYSELSGAFLNEAKLGGSEIRGNNFANANLSGAVLNNAVMRVTNLSNAILNDANLEGADLTGSVVEEENWLEKLENWQIKGAQQIQEKYDIGLDESGVFYIYEAGFGKRGMYIPVDRIRSSS